MRLELARVLKSEYFLNSDRLNAFLSYVVRETLEGRGVRIKEYTIAVEVFGKPADFDGSTDPIVRTTAARLRSALERFYGQDPDPHEVEIRLPKGSYIPEFNRSPIQARPGFPPLAPPIAPGVSFRRWAPPILVAAMFAGGGLFYWRAQTPPDEVIEPITIIATPIAAEHRSDAQNYSRYLLQDILAGLAAFGSADVVNATCLEPVDPACGNMAERIAHYNGQPGMAFLLNLRVSTTQDGWGVHWQLVEAMTGTIAMDGDISQSSSSPNKADVDELVNDVLGVEGAVPLAVAKLSRNQQLTCMANAQRTGIFFDLELGRSVWRCLHDMSIRHPESGAVWGLLAHVSFWVAKTASAAGEDPAPYVETLDNATARALALAPGTYYTQRAATLFSYQAGQLDLFQESVRQLIERYGADRHMRGALAFALVRIGELDKAIQMIDQGAATSPAGSTTGSMVKAFAAYVRGDYEEASRWIKRTQLPHFYMLPLTSAAIQSELGDRASAMADWNRLLELNPDFQNSFFQDCRFQRTKIEYCKMLSNSIKKLGIEIFN